jgi:hypothetical protein
MLNVFILSARRSGTTQPIFKQNLHNSSIRLISKKMSFGILQEFPFENLSEENRAGSQLFPAFETPIISTKANN